MTVVEALKKHHEEIRELFDEVENSPELFYQLKQHLMVHHRNEELFLLNKIRDMDEFKSDSLESIEEHHVLDMLLNDLEDFPMDNERWKVKFLILKEYTEHHLSEEEEDIFGKASQKLDDSDLKSLGNEFTRRKKDQLAALINY